MIFSVKNFFLNRVATLLLIICCANIFVAAQSTNNVDSNRQNEFIVGFDNKEALNAFKTNSQLKIQNSKFIICKLLPSINACVVRTETNLTTKTQKQQFLDQRKLGTRLKSKNSNLKYFEKNAKFEYERINHDIGNTSQSIFGYLQWHHQPLNSTGAWDWITAVPDFPVAMIDQGFWHKNYDLTPNTWRNPGEIPENGVDDDNNGYIDDWTGIDLSFSNHNNPCMDGFFHGSLIAEMILGCGNNGEIGSGVCWRGKLMNIYVWNLYIADIIEGMDYAEKYGAKIINCSFGGGSYNQALKDRIEILGKSNIIVVCSAGNDGINTDETPHYPSGYELDNIISVGGLAKNLGWQYNYGTNSVDIAAFARDLLFDGTSHSKRDCIDLSDWLHGTSFAVPQVAGACALVWQYYPQLTYTQVIEAVLKGVTVVPAYSNKCATSGLLNVGGAIKFVQDKYGIVNHQPRFDFPNSLGEVMKYDKYWYQTNTMFRETYIDGIEFEAGKTNRLELPFATDPDNHGFWFTLEPCGMSWPEGCEAEWCDIISPGFSKFGYDLESNQLSVIGYQFNNIPLNPPSKGEFTALRPTLVWKPELSQTGSYDFWYYVCDGKLKDQLFFNLKVVEKINEPPVFTNPVEDVVYIEPRQQFYFQLGIANDNTNVDLTWQCYGSDRDSWDTYNAFNNGNIGVQSLYPDQVQSNLIYVFDGKYMVQKHLVFVAVPEITVIGYQLSVIGLVFFAWQRKNKKYHLSLI